MGSVTIRNLPDGVVAEIKAAAALHGRSLEGELRELLQRRYRSREEVLTLVRERWNELPRVTAKQVDAWIEAGRK
jgi:plasmid stability protein